MGQIPSTAENIVLKENLKRLLLDIEHPIGSIWIGGKYEEPVTDSETGDVIHAAGKPIKPADIFGGTWKLIDKEFKSMTYSDDGEKSAFSMSNYISAYRIAAIYGGHTIRMRFDFTPNIAFNDDSSIRIGTFNLDEIGVTGFYNTISDIPAMSDPANGLVMASISNSGAVDVNDIVKSTTANQRIYINYEITCLSEDMFDEFCDKFYWRRIEPTEVTE